MGLGDIESNERGSGARYNDGKIPYELISWSPMALALDIRPTREEPLGVPHKSHVRWALVLLGEFQSGGGVDSLAGVLHQVSHAAGMSMPELYAETARVLEYGKRKYAEFNWAKGMSWQSVIACAARHLLGTPDVPGMWDDPKGLDPESGLMHAGHVACNVMFLLQFMRSYPEGDDRPKVLVEKPF